MKSLYSITVAAAAMSIGIDLARKPDRTVYWQPPRKPKVPDPKKRAKVKAARKQRNAKP